MLLALIKKVSWEGTGAFYRAFSEKNSHERKSYSRRYSQENIEMIKENLRAK